MSRKLFRHAALVDLLVKEISHRFAVEFDCDFGASLFDQPDVFDQKQIVDRADTERTDFGLVLAGIA